MNRTYQTFAQIKAEYPGMRMWILIGPTGSSFMVRHDDEEFPNGKYALLGVIP